MQHLFRLSRAIDWLNDRIGRSAMWLVLVVTLISAGNAVSRYGFSLSSNAMLEVQWYLYSAVFLLCAGYNLLHNQHVRIDLISNRLSARGRNWVDVIGIVVFLIPVAVMIAHMSWPALVDSWLNHEQSSNAGGLIRWPVRALIPLGFGLLALQGCRSSSSGSPSWQAGVRTRSPPSRTRAMPPSKDMQHDRISHRQHGADDVRPAHRLPAERLSGGLRAGRQWHLLRLSGHRARHTHARAAAGPARTGARHHGQRHPAGDPFFTFMGIILERSGMAEDLLESAGQLFGPIRGGIAYAVIFVGALLAATTGVVAASVIAMGLISLPVMLRYGYSREVASGVICASGTLAQIIPPSLVLIVLADVLGVSVGDAYKGALIPR